MKGYPSSKFIGLLLSSMAVLSFMFVSGCGYSPDIADRPKVENFGQYKIGEPYQINGKWYYPKEDYGYNTVGLASWYGPGFNGKKTANGERYDQNALTAAHPTLPIPCLIKVTNLENQKTAILRVNDRGPYHGRRIIDVSKKAAEVLGFKHKGTAKVKVEILAEESKLMKWYATTGKGYLTTREHVASVFNTKLGPDQHAEVSKD